MPRNQKSFTQSEIEYAQTLGKPVLVVLTPDFSSALDEPCSLEEAQLNFYQSLINNKMLPIRIQRKGKNNLNKILTEYTSNNMVSFPGWSRNDITGKELEQWAQEHSNYNLNGIWYHFHYSDEDRNYLRAGTISIVQDFTPSGYKKYKFYGQNFGFKEDNNKRIILSENGSPVIDNEMYSNWDGEYDLQTNNYTLSGIYRINRGYSESNFAGQTENVLRTKGIHDFYLSSSSLETPNFFHGMFYDIASLKHGKISVFKSQEERDKKIIEHLNDYNLLSK